MRRDQLSSDGWRPRRPGPDERAKRGSESKEADRSLAHHQSLTPSERVMRSRMAAYILHARYDAHQTTAASHVAFMARFLKEVDPEQKLPEPERRRRAAAAKSAYFSRLAYLSARKRRRS